MLKLKSPHAIGLASILCCAWSGIGCHSQTADHPSAQAESSSREPSSDAASKAKLTKGFGFELQGEVDAGAEAYESKQYTTAMEHYQKAYKVMTFFRSADDRNEDKGYAETLAKLTERMGRVCYDMKNYPDAREYFQESLHDFEKSKGPNAAETAGLQKLVNLAAARIQEGAAQPSNAAKDPCAGITDLFDLSDCRDKQR